MATFSSHSFVFLYLRFFCFLQLNVYSLSIDYLFEAHKVFYLGASHPFSHLHPAKITAHGHVYSTTEQMYQIAKSDIGLDPRAHDELLHVHDGYAQKRIGKRIRNRHPHIWDLVKTDVMMHADFCKFQQNPHLQHELLRSGHSVLVENNRYDRFWGPPGNHAGDILMDIRRDLRGDVSFLPRTLIVGDSLLAGLNQDHFTSRLQQQTRIVSLPGAKLECVQQCAAYMCGPYVRRLVIFGGTNSICNKQNQPRMGPHKLLKHARSFLDRFAPSTSSCEIYVCTILNRPRNRQDRIHSHLTRYNEFLIHSSVSGVFPSNVKVLDFGFLPTDCFASDGLHLSSTGCEVFAQLLVTMLR